MSNWRELGSGNELDDIVSERIFGDTVLDGPRWKTSTPAYIRDNQMPVDFLCKYGGNPPPGVDREAIWQQERDRCRCSARKKARGASVPKYSQSIAAAWRVVDAMTGYSLMLVDEFFSYPRWRCSFKSHTNGDTSIGKADNAPLAICRAALAVLESQPMELMEAPNGV